MKTLILAMALVTIAVTAAVAAEGFVNKGTERSITLPPPAVTLKEGPGMEVTRGYCAICHSLDYITTQQKFPHAKWQAEVTKMIKVYGAPIDEVTAKIIANYITAAYGKGD